MNTMKKEDIQKELGQLVNQIGFMTINLLHPFSQLIAAVGRVAYLQNQLELVTPKVAPQQQEEKKDAKMDEKEKTA